MRYTKHPTTGDQLSALSYGCMRFNSSYEQTEQQLLHAIDRGINYFDTAYIYSGSEATLGRILEENNLRDNVYLATKLPHYFCKDLKSAQHIFAKQQERLRTHTIDYYLMHMLTSVQEWERMCSFGMDSWLENLKQSGRIRSIGFSFHGGVHAFKALVDAYSWDFCMIQYNYYDKHNQAGHTGLTYAHGKGIPVMIMEPLRGGRLAQKLPREVEQLFASTPGRAYSPAEQALRWLYNQPEVFTVLSGMNSLEMIDQNADVAEHMQPSSLTAEELSLFATARDILLHQTAVPCTGCGYCMPCPHGVDIPLCFTALGDLQLMGRIKGQFNYIVRTNNQQASLCRQCGLCEPKCPQGIAIRQDLQLVQKKLEGMLYKPLRAIIKKAMKLK